MNDEEHNELVNGDHLSLSNGERRSRAVRCKNKEQVCWLVLAHHVQKHMPAGQGAYYDRYQVPDDNSFYVRSISSMMQETRDTLEQMYVYGDTYPPCIKPDNERTLTLDMMLDLMEMD